MFSKKEGDNLPFTTTSVEEKPCLNPGEVSENGETYPLELERHSKFCEIDEAFRVAYDERYIKAGLRISEYDL